MRKVFLIANISHLVLLSCKYNILMSEFVSLIFGFLISANLTYYVSATFIWLISKDCATSVDNKFMKINVSCIIARLVTMSVAVLGLRDIGWLILFNLSAIIIYFLIYKYQLSFSNYDIAEVAKKKELNNYRL